MMRAAPGMMPGRGSGCARVARSLQDELRKAGLVGSEASGRAGGAGRSASRPRKGRPERAGAPSGEGAVSSTGSLAPVRRDLARGVRVKEAPPSAPTPTRSSVQLRSQLARSRVIARDPLLRGDADPKVAARRRNQALLERARRHRLDDPQASRPFYFARGRRIRKYYVTEEQHRALVGGEIVILGMEGEYLLLPLAFAEEIRGQRPEVFVHRAGAGAGSGDDEDPRHAVPDDLVG